MNNVTTKAKNKAHTKEGVQGVQSIHRTISLLRTVAESNDRGMRLFEIAKKTGLTSATAHRILNVLVSENYLDYDSLAKEYRLGIELHILGNKAKRFALREKYRSCLEKIAIETGDSVFLVIRSAFDALCIDYIQSNSPIRIISYTIGTRKPLGIGSGGLALLAFLSNKTVDTVIKANRHRYAQPGSHYNKITVTALRGMIKRAREMGFVVSEGVYMKDVWGVGVPLYNHKGEIEAAISVGSISRGMNMEKAKTIAEYIKSEVSLYC